MYYFANLFIYIQYIVSYICVTFLFEYIKHLYYSCDAKLNFQHLYSSLTYFTTLLEVSLYLFILINPALLSIRYFFQMVH